MFTIIITLGAQFTEVNGHVDLCDREDSSETVHNFAVRKFGPLFKSGFAYREVCSKGDISAKKLLNKSVILSKVYRYSY